MYPGYLSKLVENEKLNINRKERMPATMSGIHETTTKTLLDYISNSSTANSEEDMSYLLTLMQPTDNRIEMGQVYTNLLGYDPITYFDEKYVHKAYETILMRAPGNVKRLLTEKKEELITETMTRFESTREEYLLNLLMKVIMDETGWTDPDYEGFDYEALLDLGLEFGESTSGGFEIDDDDEEDPLEEEDDNDEDNDEFKHEGVDY